MTTAPRHSDRRRDRARLERLLAHRGGWRSAVLWTDARRGVSSPGRQDRSRLERSEAFRLTRRAAHQVRVGRQPQDRQSPRPHDPAVGAGAGGPGHRVARAGPRALSPRLTASDACSSSRWKRRASAPCWCPSWPSARLPGSMRLIGLAVVLAVSLIVVPLAADAEQPKTRPRIGFLLMGSPQAGLTFAFDAFREGLRELGWTENENIAIEYRRQPRRTWRLRGWS